MKNSTCSWFCWSGSHMISKGDMVLTMVAISYYRLRLLERIEIIEIAFNHNIGFELLWFETIFELIIDLISLFFPSKDKPVAVEPDVDEPNPELEIRVPRQRKFILFHCFDLWYIQCFHAHQSKLITCVILFHVKLLSIQQLPILLSTGPKRR